MLKIITCYDRLLYARVKKKIYFAEFALLKIYALAEKRRIYKHEKEIVKYHT